NLKDRNVRQECAPPKPGDPPPESHYGNRVRGQVESTMRSLRRLLGPRLGLHRQYSPRPLVLRLPTRPRAHSDDLPGISIVTPSFNQGRFLERTVRSVLDQGYSGLEYIVQDGGSTDETAPILGRYSSALATCDSRQDRGQAHALNLGFARSR